MDVAGGDYVQAGPVGQGHEPGQEPLVAPSKVALELDEEVVRAEEVSVALGDVHGQLPPARHQELWNLPLPTARQGDEAFGMVSEIPFFQAGHPFLLILTGQRDQPTEVGVPFRGFDQEGEVETIFEGHLGAQEGLDAHFLCGLRKAHCSVEGVVIREGESGDLQIGRAGRQSLGGGDAVEEAVAGVGVELGVAVGD